MIMKEDGGWRVKEWGGGEGGGGVNEEMRRVERRTGILRSVYKKKSESSTKGISHTALNLRNCVKNLIFF